MVLCFWIDTYFKPKMLILPDKKSKASFSLNMNKFLIFSLFGRINFYIFRKRTCPMLLNGLHFHPLHTLSISQRLSNSLIGWWNTMKWTCFHTITPFLSISHQLHCNKNFPWLVFIIDFECRWLWNILLNQEKKIGNSS